MAQITKPPVLDDTYKAAQASTNALLASISGSLGVLAKAQSGVIPEMDYNAIKAVVAAGNAPLVFPTGTQLANTYTDKDGKEYDCPWDVVQPDDTAEGESGTTAPAMVLQMHYATLYDMQFSAYQAFYVVPDNGMVAGTYNVTMGIGLGDNVKKDTTYQFTLTKNAPAGARLTGFYRASDMVLSNWKVYVYKDQQKSELLETCSVKEGSEGTNLGTFLAMANGDLNSLYLVFYGDSRWYKSAYRQYLNSDAAAGAWWQPQDKWDMKPDQADTVPGFLSGFSDAFKNALVATKVVTYGNNITDDGSAVTTFDKVFLPSLQEIYCRPQVSGEGTYWPYWKERSGAIKPQEVINDFYYPSRISYSLANHTTPESCRTRTLNRGQTSKNYFTSLYGAINNWYPVSQGYKSTPACKMVGMV